MDTKALRQKILDLAIRGKLVPQNPDDEPASVLLEKIRVEKQNMVKEGKLKPKDVKNDTIIFRGDDNLHYEKFQDGTVKCIEDEIPFDVPNGWEYVRLCNVTSREIKRGKSPKYIEEGKTLVFAQKCNRKTGEIDISLAKFLDGSILSKYPADEFMCNGDIVINSTGTGTLGRVGIYYDKDNMTGNRIVPDSHVTIVRAISYIDFDYIYAVLKSYQSLIETKGEGSTNQKELKPLTLQRFIIPIPPHKEQFRIVKYINDLWNQIYTIDNDGIELSEIINSCKEKVLNLAMRGKLISQDPVDEPASLLLERIRNERKLLINEGKIKRDKRESFIYRGDDNSYYEKYIDGSTKCISEEIPFDLPSSWEWCRLSDIVDLYSGQDLTPDKYNDNMIGIPYITGASNLDNGKVIVNRWTDTPTTHAIPGDLLLTCKGSGVGKMAFNNIEDCHIARQIMALRSKNLLNKDYLKIVLDAFIKDITEQANGIIPGVRREVILSFIFPLPPSEEQKRIVSTVEKIFENFETLKISLI